MVGRAPPDEWPLPEVNFVEDAVPGLGPAGGLATALRHAQTSVLALACDLPLLTEDALRWLAELRNRALQSMAVSRSTAVSLEPLFSIYRPLALPLMEAQLAAGRRSLQRADRGRGVCVGRRPGLGGGAA